MLCMMDTCHYTFFETDRKYITKSKPFGYYVSMQFHVINVVIVPNVTNVPLCWDMLIMGETIAFLEQLPTVGSYMGYLCTFLLIFL